MPLAAAESITLPRPPTGNLTAILRLAWAVVLASYTGWRDVMILDTACHPDERIVSVKIPLSRATTIEAALKQAMQSSNGNELAESLLVVHDIHSQHDLSWPSREHYSTAVLCDIQHHTVTIHAALDGAVWLPGTTHMMLCQYRHLVHQISTSVTISIADLNGISPEGLGQLANWNSQGLSASSSKLGWPLIQQRCREQPQALAIDAWDGRLTYAQLEQHVTAAAARLQAAGVQAEQFTALLLDKSLVTTVVLLGVMKAGGAFLLLDATHPPRRLRTMCQRIGAKLVVASAQHADVAAQLGVPVLSAELVSSPDMPPEAATYQTPSVEPQHALYAGFTSGSTGEPKGFVITQAAFSSGLEAYRHSVGLDQHSRVFQFASYAFVVSITSQLAPLTCGACLCVPSQEQLENNLAGAIHAQKATWIALTPSVARTLDPDIVPTLKTMVLVGEGVCQADLHQWRQLTLYSLYGQSEHAKGTLVAHQVDGADPSNLGRPFCGRGWVVDRNDPLRLVPVGAEGELVLESPCLSRGYLDASETQAAFFANPPWLLSVRPHTQGRFFRTGDLVRQHPRDGSFHLLGRKGTRVKIRGQRVELGEVEHQLSQLLSTARTVVTDIICAADDINGKTPMLLAFVQLQPSSSAGDRDSRCSLLPPTHAFRHLATQARWQLQKILPSFMIPAAIVEVSSIPRTATGKIHRGQLRECAAACTRQQLLEYIVHQVAHRDAESRPETILQQLCAQVLGCAAGDIGLDNSFIDLGGHSLSARQIVTLARAQGLTVSLAHLLQQWPLAEVAKQTTTASQAVSDLSELNSDTFAPLRDSFLADLPPSLDRDNIQDVYPSLELQAAYATGQVVDCFPLHLTGPVDVARLQYACQALVEQHAILRTVFHKFQRKVVQVVLRRLPVSFTVHQCKSAADANRWTEAFGVKEMAKRYDITQPIIGFVLVQALRDQHHILLMRLSHGQYDALCLRPLIHGLWNAYRNESIPRHSEYKTHVQRCFKRRTTHAYTIWREILEAAPLPVLPLTPPLSENSDATLAVFERALPEVNPLPGTTQASMIKTAWLETLWKETGRKDVVFGQFVQAWTGTEKVMGPCMNVIPVRVKARPEWTRRQLLQAIQSQHAHTSDVDALGWQDISANCTDWPGDTWPDSVVLHQNFDRHIEMRVDEDLVCRKTMPILSSWPVFPVLLVTHPGKGKLDALLLISTKFGVQQDADRMLDHFAAALRQLEEDPDGRMLSNAEHVDVDPRRSIGATPISNRQKATPLIPSPSQTIATA
ncbi:hypothetical protein MYU51_014001 [Penicillium brevicompactum]|uniref:peptide synthetase n=1 Tax=Penicillium brevicompactum TaxID=5074 RepID=UPI00254069BB|nr:peptide synthetase [Penicillium brevicompactum]KAJ5319047.1 peptide synthetase [Penicillium brevicompactum]